MDLTPILQTGLVGTIAVILGGLFYKWALDDRARLQRAYERESIRADKAEERNAELVDMFMDRAVPALRDSASAVTSAIEVIEREQRKREIEDIRRGDLHG